MHSDKSAEEASMLRSYTRSDIENLDRVFRLNLINSVSGYKPANLLGTISSSGTSNLSVISSALHLSSSPALIGFMQRPTTVPRHSYENIKETSVFTLNHIQVDFTDKAHYTSAKFPKEQSEFEACGFSEYYEYGFAAPFVRNSRIKMGLSFREEYHIKSSNTILIVGQIELLILPSEIIGEDGQLNLNLAGTAAISGLNTYHSGNKLATYAYARPGEFPKKQD